MPVARSTSRVSRASIVTDRLCGSIPITTRSITILLTLDPAGRISEDGQRCFEQSRPFSSHASPRCTTGPHAMREPHQAERWAADETATGRAPTRD
jgi:hypothetical protein